MKRFATVFWALAACVPAMVAGLPVEVRIGDVSYCLDEDTGTAVIKKCHEGAGTLVVSETVSYEGCDYVVNGIGDSAFYGVEAEKVELPGTILSIGKWAFANSSLKTVRIPDSVEWIGGWAFNDCRNLTSVTVGNSVQRLLDGCFYNCSSLSSVVLGNSLTMIGSSAFNCCKALKALEIPASVKRIASGAFFGCSGIEDVVMPFSVESVGVNAFYDCTSLAAVTFGSGMRLIEQGAFDNCPAVKDVYCLAGVPPEMVPGITYKDGFFKASLHVPEGSGKAYSESKGWSGFVAGTPTPLIKSQSISLGFRERTIEIGDTISAGLCILPCDASFSACAAWHSDNPSVVSVDAFGTIIALAAGECTLTATTLDGTGLSDECRIKVVSREPVTITLDCSEAWVWMKSTRTLNATVSPDGVHYGWIVWSSSDERVATVSACGTIAPVSVGDTEITASIADASGLSGISASCLVHIIEMEAVESVSEDPDAMVEVLDVSGKTVFKGRIAEIPYGLKGLMIVKRLDGMAFKAIGR